LWPSQDDLQALFKDRYGLPRPIGWSPARRLEAGYFLPAEIYEATVVKQIFNGCAWLDVGGGHNIFPEHPALSQQLAAKCDAVVAIDPDPAVHENRFVTERHQCRIEEYQDERRFHVATFRMVAEHVEEPALVVRALRRLLGARGVAIVFTVNRWSPVSIAARVVPFRLHHPIKRLFWGGEERDTFPVRYRMNTRTALRQAFESEGFTEMAFAYLDDLSTFGSMKWGGAMELAVWRRLNQAGVGYPENCLLGVYRAAG
jgi:SAM-dependent methyltransferase